MQVLRVRGARDETLGVHVERDGCQPSRKTRMNDPRYNASGTVHNSGIGAISVVICAVTARSSTEGTVLSASHRRR